MYSERQKEREQDLLVTSRFSNRCLDARSGRGRWVITRSWVRRQGKAMAAGCWRWRWPSGWRTSSLAWHPFWSHPLGQLRESMVPWYIHQGNRTVGGGNSLQGMHKQTPPLKGPRYAALATKSCGALAQSPPPTRSNRGAVHRDWMPESLLLLECTGAIMSSQCTTHKPPSSVCMCPSARNAVRLPVSALLV